MPHPNPKEASKEAKQGGEMTREEFKNPIGIPNQLRLFKGLDKAITREQRPYKNRFEADLPIKDALRPGVLFHSAPRIESLDRKQSFFTILPPQQLPVPGKNTKRKRWGRSLKRTPRSLKPPKAWLKYYNQSIQPRTPKTTTTTTTQRSTTMMMNGYYYGMMMTPPPTITTTPGPVALTTNPGSGITSTTSTLGN